MDLLTVILVLPTLTAFGWLCIKGTRTALLVTLLMGTLALMAWGWIDWVFRDGLGTALWSAIASMFIDGLLPNHASSGDLAWQKFWSQFEGRLTAWTAFIAVSVVVWLIKSKRTSASAMPERK
jgi:hypothetical protein